MSGFTPLDATDSSPTTISISMSQAMNQLSKGQDQTYTGEFIDIKTGEKVYYAIELDGHGSDHCINKLRTMDFVPFLQMDNPVEEIAKCLIREKTVPHYMSSGACISIALIYTKTNNIVLLNCGDCQTALFMDDELLYINEPHDLDRMGELEHVKKHGTFWDITQSSGFRIISPNQLQARASKYVRYSTGNMLAPTRSLGHNGIVNSDAERAVFPMEAGKKYRIVLASDGVFDVAIIKHPEDIKIFTELNDAATLVNYYSNRWLQEWGRMETMNSSLVTGGTFRFTKGDCDDVSAVVIDIVLTNR